MERSSVESPTETEPKEIPAQQVGTFMGIPVILSKQLSKSQTSVGSRDLFKTALQDLEQEYTPDYMDELQLKYNEYGEISYRALEAIAELHRRGDFIIEEVEKSRDVNNVGPPGDNITVKSHSTVKIKMRKGHNAPF